MWCLVIYNSMIRNTFHVLSASFRVSECYIKEDPYRFATPFFIGFPFSVLFRPFSRVYPPKFPEDYVSSTNVRRSSFRESCDVEKKENL